MNRGELRDLFYHGYQFFREEYEIKKDYIAWLQQTNQSIQIISKEEQKCEELSKKTIKFHFLSQTADYEVEEGDENIFLLSADDIIIPEDTDKLFMSEVYFLHKIVHYCPRHRCCFCSCPKYTHVRYL